MRTRCCALLILLLAACGSPEDDSQDGVTNDDGDMMGNQTGNDAGGGRGGDMDIDATAGDDGPPPPLDDCADGDIAADEVVWTGDSWIDIPGNQKTRVDELARAAGTIGPNESFVDLAVSGTPIRGIIDQYNGREAGPIKVKVLLMDGGGIDTIRGGGSEASVTAVVNAFTEHLAQIAADGTVLHVVYFLYPELPTIAGVAALRPGTQAACAESAVPCHFLDLQPRWEGHPEFTGPDRIHPSQAGANVIGEAIWNIMEENCIAQ